MSKDMLGSLLRALVGVAPKFLGLLLDIANRLNEKNEDGESFYRDLAKFVRDWKKSAAKVAGTLTHFFETREGLWVDGDFRRLVLTKVTVGAPVEIKPFDLPRNMSDSDIESELGGGHIWDESILCATIKKMIEDQWDGKGGKLLNNGYANLFYTPSCVVYVDWDSDDRKWRVRTWERGDGRWRAGSRVFSRN